MEQTLTDEEVRTLYQDYQREPFNRNKQIFGAVYALILLVAFVAAYTCLVALLMNKIGSHDKPADATYTAVVL